MIKRTAVLLVYCLPAMLAIAVLIFGYYLRSEEVSRQILVVADGVRESDEASVLAVESEHLDGAAPEHRLIDLLERKKRLGRLDTEITPAKVRREILELWAFNSLIVAGFTLLPFVLLGGRLAFRQRRRTRLPRDIFQVARRNSGMKLLVGFAIAFGWIYIMNPAGRGASLIFSFVNSQDPLSASSLPIYIDAQDLIAPTVCGFMGWYLHLLGYFFRKVVLDDVVSTRVYDLLFRKLLLVYGIGLLISGVVTEQGKLVLFLIGFFPLNTLGVLREFAQKSVPGAAPPRDALAAIPSISRWQVLRLEEEGIDSLPSLAASRPDVLAAFVPVKPALVHLWVDAARLISLLGAEKYAQVSRYSLTASEFVRRHQEPEFVKALAESCEIDNPEEIVRLLESSFEDEPRDPADADLTIVPTGA